MQGAMTLLLTEAFESVTGIFLDRGTSLFETLELVSAEVVSERVSADCRSLAAQVKHVGFYLGALLTRVQNPEADRPDWDGIWRNDAPVSDREWREIVADLGTNYDRARDLINTIPSWSQDTVIGANAMIAHSAYHLGSIRQALCVASKVTTLRARWIRIRPLPDRRRTTHLL